MHRRTWGRRILVAVGVAATTWCALFIVTDPRQDVTFGVTFSPRHAQWLGLDAHAVYVDMLESLGVRHVRLPVYWDSVEPTPNSYDFSETDIYLAEAAARGVTTIVSIGYKQPRWPECHPPAWTRDLSRSQLRQHVLTLVAAEVTYLRNQPGIVMWQVENEPFVRFGNCDFDVLTGSFVEEEVNLVHRLDGRPVLLTDTGEGSPWLQALRMPSVQFGVSVYRDIPVAPFGVVQQPLPAWTYALRDWAGRRLVKADGLTMISELQAEAWFETTEGLDELAEIQRQQFPPELILAQNVEFARRTHFSRVYLWGVEWWYSMAAHRHGEYLDVARKLLHQQVD